MLATIPYADEAGHALVTVDFSDLEARAITPFLQEQDGTRQWWRLTADFLWFDSTHLIRVRRGFGWNGANVPAAVRWYEAPGDHLAASVFHDAGYTYHWIEAYDFGSRSWICVRLTKSYTDALFFAINLSFYGVRLSKSCALWEAVHLFGLWPWYTDVCPLNCAACKGSAATDCPYRGYPKTFAHWRLT